MICPTTIHFAISWFWAGVLAGVLPHRRQIAWAVLASSVIAVVELFLIGEFIPMIDAPANPLLSVI